MCFFNFLRMSLQVFCCGTTYGWLNKALGIFLDDFFPVPIWNKSGGLKLQGLIFHNLVRAHLQSKKYLGLALVH